jgi:long-chain acyl-CoA synthetase
VGINIGQVLRQWAVRDGERVALVLAPARPHDARREVTFGELDLRARRAAARLHALGIGPGDRVALSIPNGLAFLDAWFGCLYVGAITVPVPPMSAAPEPAHRLEHARVKLLLGSAATHALCQAARALVPAAAFLDAHELADAQGTSDGPVDLPAGAVAMILYTSGTTGAAKGAMITHASLATHTAALVHHVLALTADDVVLASLPLTHSYGLRMTLLAPFYAGARAVLLERFSAHRVRELVTGEGITWFPGVPTMFHALAHEPPLASNEAPKLRWCLSAGAPLPREIRLKAEAALHSKVRQGFGLTEATFSTISLPHDDEGADTVGHPVFGVEVRIVDEQGKELPPGTPGEICIRGQNVMAGYLDDPEATTDVTRNGFLHSGDIGVIDEQGRLTVVDRIKDMIIRGGFNVYPAEVEAALVEHPSVRDAVVVGIEDPHYGEEVVAVLVLEPGLALDVSALDVFCRARLSRTKLPRLYGTLHALPVGASGKVLRRSVRALVHESKVTLSRVP